MGATANARTNEARPPPENSVGPGRNRTIPGAIKGLFRQAAKAVTRDAEDQEPRKRRVKEGERDGGMMRFALRFSRRLGARAARPGIALQAARKGFKAAQQAATQRSAEGNGESFDAAGGYLADTLALFQQWEDEALTGGFDDYCGFDQNYSTLDL